MYSELRKRRTRVVEKMNNVLTVEEIAEIADSQFIVK
jgi:hypothetical protein